MRKRGGGGLVGLLDESAPVFYSSVEVADVNEVERPLGKCPARLGVIDLE